MKKTSARRHRVMLWVISLLVISSMLCSFVVMLRPPTERVPVILPTATVAPSPSPTLTEP
ncbi:MAG: hypothetical protein ACYC5M_03675 [Anaerolineae bacterium]